MAAIGLPITVSWIEMEIRNRMASWCALRPSCRLLAECAVCVRTSGRARSLSVIRACNGGMTAIDFGAQDKSGYSMNKDFFERMACRRHRSPRIGPFS